MARGRRPGRYGTYDRERTERSKFGNLLHEKFLDIKGRKISQSLLAQNMGIKAPTLTLMLQEDKELVKGNRLYILFKNLAVLLAEFQVSIFEDQARELLARIDREYFSQQQEKALIIQLTQELIVKREYRTLQGLKLIGRDQDIATIYTKLTKDGIQFLTIIGEPGVGKTELARQIEQLVQMHEYFTQVSLISFEKVTSINEVILAIDDHLPDTNQQTRILIILDDCEQVKDIDEERERFYAYLKDQEQLTILATSRRRFSYEEHNVSTLEPPLSEYEPVEDLQTYAAIQLFLEIAKKRDKDFALTDENAPKVAALCIVLDGLPLALKIVASRVKEKTIEGLYNMLLRKSIQTLPDAFPGKKRHVSLDEAITVSYVLLDEPEKKFFRRLGIFAAPSRIESAAAVCRLSELSVDDVERIILKLSDYSLLFVEDQQIRMHNTLRDYARRLLEDEKRKKEEQQLEARYIDYYRELTVTYVLADISANYDVRSQVREFIRSYYTEIDEKIDEKMDELEQYISVYDVKDTLEDKYDFIEDEFENFKNVYIILSEIGLISIETKTARLLGEREEKAISRIKALVNGEEYLEDMTAEEVELYVKARDQVVLLSEHTLLKNILFDYMFFENIIGYDPEIYDPEIFFVGRPFSRLYRRFLSQSD